MSILSRMRSALSSKANAALDKSIDPEKQIDMVIAELDAAHKQGLQELVGYKATDKQLQAELGRLDERIAAWEKRAMEAVRAGDDELAKQALKEKRAAEAEKLRVSRDRAEAQTYAVELNRSRKQVETRLAMLKLKKGTLAQQLAAARAGGDTPLSATGALWENFEKAEQRIEDQAIEAEVDGMLGAEDMAAASASEKVRVAAGKLDADQQLAALKSKMDAERAKKKP